MSRLDPPHSSDLLLMTVHQVWGLAVLGWVTIAVLAVVFPPPETSIMVAIVRGAPPFLVGLLALFYLFASQSRPFRQRLMNPRARSGEALRSAVILAGCVLVYLIQL